MGMLIERINFIKYIIIWFNIKNRVIVNYIKNRYLNIYLKIIIVILMTGKNI